MADSERDLIVLGEGWTDAVRAACDEWCAEGGDKPCWALVGDTVAEGGNPVMLPCADCLSNTKDMGE